MQFVIDPIRRQHCADTGPNADADADADTGPNADADADADTGPNADADADAGPDADLCNIALAESVFAQLGMTTEGAPSSVVQSIPTILSGPNWAMKDSVCQDGCYDLSAFAGQQACFVSQNVSNLCADEPSTAWVVMRGNQIACVYSTVRENSMLVPGVCAVNNACSR